MYRKIVLLNRVACTQCMDAACCYTCRT